MSDLEIYRRRPLFEREWSVFDSRRRAALAPSDRWYGARLTEHDGPLCELACGYGRLLLSAARAGRAVVGMDAVPERVNAARRVFREHGLAGEFRVQRLPALPRDRRFAGVVLACNGLGFVHAEEAKRGLLAGIREILLPGGRFLFDHRRGSGVVRALGRWPSLRGTLASSGRKLRSELRWDRESGCIRERFFEDTPQGERLLGTDLFRFPSARRTLAMVSQAGFSLERVCGSFDGAPLRPWSTRLVAVARRR